MSTHEADRRDASSTAGGPPARSSGRGRAGRLATRLGALALVVAAGAWAVHANLYASRRTMDMQKRVSSSDAPFPVETALAARAPIAGSARYTGSVAPFNEEDIYPRVTGRIVELPVYPGDAVRPGQLLVRLDDVELGSRAREAEAAASAARANLAQMDADAEAARHGVVQMERELAMGGADVEAARRNVVQMERESAMAEAEVQHQELFAAQEERLYRTGATSRHEVENQRAMVAAARAKVQAARAKVEQAQAMVAAAEARLEAARARADQARAMESSALRKREAMAAMAIQSQAQLRTAQVVQDYVRIVASSPGYVVKRLVAPGVLVQPGMVILKVAQIDRVRLQANVAERDLSSIRVGSPVTVTPAGNGQPPFPARVTSVFPFVEPGSRTAVVEAVVDNPGRRLLPGQYVAMQFVTGERAEAVVVPRTAIVRIGGKATVWMAREDRVRPVVVVTGLEGTDGVEITAGLAGGERVVTRGHEGLYADARVTDTSGPAPAPAGHGAPAPAKTPPGDAPRADHGANSGAPLAPGPAKEGTHATH